MPRDLYPRIVVLRSGAVGDCILSTPALTALRRQFPSSHITLVGDPFSADIFHNSPDLDRVIAMDSKQMSTGAYLAELLKLRLNRFSLLLDLHGNGRSFVQTLLIGGKRRIGFDIRQSHNFAYTDRADYRSDVHTILRQAEILKPLGIRLDENDTPLRLELTHDEREQARRLLWECGLEPGKPFVVLHSGAGLGGILLKQWDPEKFASVADKIQKTLGLAVVATGQGEEERVGVEEMREKARHPILSLFGKTRLRTLAAVLEQAEMYVGCDTGPMHLAAAVGRPIVALFGPTDPVRWHPWSRAPYRLVRAGLSCSPCAGKTCDYNVLCMRSLEVDQVFEAVSEVYRLGVLPERTPLPV